MIYLNNMKICFISDMHGKHEELYNLQNADLLCVAGDITSIGNKYQILEVFDWFERIVSRYAYGIVFIAGNHDLYFDTKFGVYGVDDDFGEKPKKVPSWLTSKINDLRTKKIYYLENSGITLEGLNIWGSPITPWFHGDRWAFNRHRGDDIKKYWNDIPYDLDILITHGPPSHILDYTYRDKEYVGCEDLRYSIKEKKPKIHVFGHIHEGSGIEEHADTVFINASILNVYYLATNDPVYVDYDIDNKTIKYL